MLEATFAHPVYSKGFEALPIPVGRHGEPAEIANFIAIMLGPDAAFMHGSIVYIDGGNDAAMTPERF